MPGPVRYDKKGRVKKTKPRSFGSASKSQPKSQAPVTAAASAVAKATKRAVSRANLPKRAKGSARKARASVLASKEAQDSIERLRQKFSTNLDINQRTAKRERKLENTALKSLYDTRGEALKAEKSVRAATRLNAEGSRVESLDGLKQVGVQPLGQVQRAADAGQIRREGKTFTTPQVRRTRRQVKRAKRELRRAKAATMTPKKNLMKAGLDAEQAQVLSTVLKVGKRRGATKKEMLAAVETAIQESGIRNLGYGDADSSGWRQERAMYYPTGKMGPQNVKASANRFFDESISDANRGAGMTAGQLAQAIQASAYPDRYDERKGEAVPLLKAFNSAGNASPKAKARLQRARTRVERLDKKAAELGLPTTRERQSGSISWGAKKARQLAGAWAGTQAILEKANRGDFQISSEKRSYDTVDGAGVSDHYVGATGSFAHDLPAVGDENGIPIAEAYHKRLGLNEPLAIGTYNSYTSRKYPGYSFQILWNVPDHYDHVHVGAKWTGADLPAGTYAGGAAGTYSQSAASGSYLASGGGGSAPPPGARTGQGGRRQGQTNVLKLLRQLGYSVTRSGVKRVGGELSTFSQAPESITDLKKRYKVE